MTPKFKYVRLFRAEIRENMWIKKKMWDAANMWIKKKREMLRSLQAVLQKLRKLQHFDFLVVIIYFYARAIFSFKKKIDSHVFYYHFFTLKSSRRNAKAFYLNHEVSKEKRIFGNPVVRIWQPWTTESLQSVPIRFLVHENLCIDTKIMTLAQLCQHLG